MAGTSVVGRMRKGVRLATVAIAAFGAAVVGYLLQAVLATQSGGLAGPSWLTVGLVIVMSIGIVAAGWPIRRALRGEHRRTVHSGWAVRTLVLAQAGALTGGLVTGWYAATVLVLFRDADSASVRSSMYAAAALCVAGLALAGAGLWTQAQCRIDDPSDDDSPGNGPGPTASSPA